jgi:anti-sigma factor RsiW
MCEHSRRLVAWLDRELNNDEVAEIRRHLETCVECRRQLAAYKQVSETIHDYGDALLQAKMYHKVPRWMGVVTAAGVAAVAAALFFLVPRVRVEPLVLPQTVAAVPPGLVPGTAPVARKVMHRRRTPVKPPSQNMNLLPNEPAIQIAIPAESMFPPGALPEGVTFTADLSIAADGSAEQIRLRPRLIGFERRTAQP